MFATGIGSTGPYYVLPSYSFAPGQYGQPQQSSGYPQPQMGLNQPQQPMMQQMPQYTGATGGGGGSGGSTPGQPPTAQAPPMPTYKSKLGNINILSSYNARPSQTPALSYNTQQQQAMMQQQELARQQFADQFTQHPNPGGIGGQLPQPGYVPPNPYNNYQQNQSWR